MPQTTVETYNVRFRTKLASKSFAGLKKEKLALQLATACPTLIMEPASTYRLHILTIERFYF